MDPAAVAWRTMTRDNRSVAVPVFLADDAEIWGATAMVVAEFLAAARLEGPFGQAILKSCRICTNQSSLRIF